MTNCVLLLMSLELRFEKFSLSVRCVVVYSAYQSHDWEGGVLQSSEYTMTTHCCAHLTGVHPLSSVVISPFMIIFSRNRFVLSADFHHFFGIFVNLGWDDWVWTQQILISAVSDRNSSSLWFIVTIGLRHDTRVADVHTDTGCSPSLSAPTPSGSFNETQKHTTWQIQE